MKKIITQICIVLLLTSCNDKTANTPTKPQKEAKPTTAVNSIDIKHNLNTIEISNLITKEVSEAEKQIAVTTPKTFHFNLDHNENTPALVWYKEGQPIKISHGVPDETGKVLDTTSYYFNNGKLWLATSPYSKNVYKNDKIMYWLDENNTMHKLSKERLTSEATSTLQIIEKILLRASRTTYAIIEGACGDIILESQPYNNLNASIKWLENKHKALLPQNHKVKKQVFKIDFNKDDRTFYGISFVNQQGAHETLGLSHVIDTRGNVYNINWCKD